MMTLPLIRYAQIYFQINIEGENRETENQGYLSINEPTNQLGPII